MNVLLVTMKNPFGAKDGGSLAILNVIEGYKNLGFDVTLLMMNTLKHFIPISQLKPKIDELDIKVIDYTIDTSIKVFDALKNLFFSKLPYNLERFYSTEFANILSDLLSKNQYSFIQFESSYLGLYLDIVKEIAPKTPLFLRAHNVEYEIWERNATVQKSFIKKIYFNIIAKRFKKWEESLFCKYDAILPITSRDKNKIQKSCPNASFFTLPYTININDFPYEDIKLNDLSIAYLGALDWIPNQEGILWFLENVWDRIYNYYPGLKFYIAGRNAPDWLEKKIKSFPVEYLGEIQDAHSFQLEHPIFVVPLLSGSGMRIKIIEQMALGRVVIATPIGAEGIDITNMENALLAQEPDDFIKNIDYLYRNPDGIRYISKNARLTVESLFDSKEIFDKLHKFILKVIGSNS
jgi:glycosyltransferase involved in cell wall biosynthesis